MAGNALSGGNNNFNFFFLRGDANHDATVDLTDFNTLAAHFGASGRFWFDGDFNYDGSVNLADFNILATRFGETLPSSSLRQPSVTGGQSQDLLSLRQDIVLGKTMLRSRFSTELVRLLDDVLGGI